MAEVWICWLFAVVTTRRFRRALRDRVRPGTPGYVAAHRPLSRRQKTTAVALSTWNRELADTPSQEFPVVAAVEPAEWDEQLGVAFDRYADEPAPFYEQLRSLEPAPLPEEITSFTLGWRKTPEGKWEVVDFAEATP